jgi:hypothetical protein
MEKVINRYHCALCFEAYKTIEEAESCFDKGSYPQVLPVGTIIALSNPNEMCFTVDWFWNKEAPHKNFRSGDSHLGGYRLSGFRDTTAGDNTEGGCGDDFFKITHLLSGRNQRYYTKEELADGAKYNAVDTSIPAFKRAVEHVRSKGLKPIYWNGSELVDVI